MNGEFFIILLVMIIIGVINNILPISSKKGVLFGANIEEENREESIFKEMIKSYRIFNFLSWILCVLIIFYGGQIVSEALQAIGILIYIALNGILIGFFNKKVKAIKKTRKNEKRQVTVATFERVKLSTGIIIYYIIISIGFIGFSSLMAYLNYDSIPEKIPTHFNLAGVADGWTTKSVGNVIFAISPIIIMVIIYIISDILIRKTQLKIDPKNKEGSYKANLKSKKLLNLSMVVTMVPMLIFATLTNMITLNLIDINYMKYITFIPIVTIVGVILLTVVFIKARNNYKVKDNSVTFKDDDDCWKFGIFYYNKNNPSVFVEKRMGIGLTVNAATIGGKIFYIVILILIIGSMTVSLIK